MAITYKQMKTFNVPDGQGNITRYEIVDGNGRICIAVDWYTDTTRSFSIGDYVLKDGVLYKFIADHEAGSEWSTLEVSVVNIGTEITSLKQIVDAGLEDLEDLQADVQNKVAKPSGDGTSGQLLATNGDGTTQWVDQGLPTDEQTATAVSAWLADHPEATTTVQDGTITKPKLSSGLAAELDGKAPAIISAYTDYRHTNVESFVMNGNNYAFGNARYANKKNLIVGVTGRLSQSVDMQAYDNIVVINGTTTSANDIVFLVDDNVDIPAGSYTFKIEPYVGSSELTNGKNMHLDVWYDGNTSNNYDNRTTLQGVKDETKSATVTLTSHVYKIRVWTGYGGSNTYSGYRLFFSLFPSDVVITDTETVIGPSETLVVTPSSSMSVVDTMMHKSTVQTIIDTKTYVDTHTQDVNFVYFRPEDYGAVGDGVADDSAALQACIDAAQSVGYSVSAAIRGEGCYRISTSAVFTCRELDVYLNKIIYTGTDAAVIISAMFSNFVFGSIRAYSGGNSAVGIRCYQSESQTFYSNKIECAFIRSDGNCVEFREYEGNTIHTMMYNTFCFQYQRSDNGNIFDVGIPTCNENACYGRYVVAPNGYLYYVDPSLGGGGIFRFYNYCLENELKNGTNGNAWFYYCRSGEMENQRTIQNPNRGFVFSWDSCVPQGEYKYGTGGVALLSINTANAYSWNDVLGAIKSKFDDDPSADNDSVWSNTLPGSTGTGIRHAEVYPVDVVTSANMRTSGGSKCIATGKAVVYYDNVAFKPDDEIYCKVTGDMTIQLTSANNWEYITPTVFDIDTTVATIRLDVSYCCIAINEFDVIQHQGKSAVVIDKLGNIIFDGRNRGAGTYHFKCDFVPYQAGEVYVTLENETVKNCPAGKLAGLYSGYNETWRIIESDAGSKAPAIYDNVNGYTHHNVNSFVAVGNPYAWGNLRYANAQNLITELTRSGNLNGVTLEPHQNIMVLNGTCGSTNDVSALINSNANIPAGTYKYKLEIHPGDSVISGTKNFYMDFWYDGNETTTYDVRVSFGVGTTDVSANVTLTNHVWKYRAWVDVKSGNVYNDYRIFYSLLPSSAVITDTGETVANGSTLRYELGDTAYVVDTLMHSSMAFGMVDTKSYVDNHTPDMVCFRPEDYGAKGDGETDDSAALQACINAAQANDSNYRAHAVRGYGTYKISTGIVFNCRELDVYLNKIIYNGNDAAVTISATYSKFEFNTIHAESGGANNVGIRCYYAATSGWTNYFYANIIKCNFLSTNGNGVEFAYLSGTTPSFYYSKFYFEEQRSYNANLIYAPVIISEIDFYGKCVDAPNGYLFYSNHRDCSSVRFYNYSLENGLKNATNAGCVFMNCRTTELMDKQTSQNRDVGRVFVWENCVPSGKFLNGTSGVDLVALDTTFAYTWEAALTGIKSVWDSGYSGQAETPWMEFLPCTSQGIRYAYIDRVSRVANANMTSGVMRYIMDGEAFVYYKNIAFKPRNDIYYKVDDDMTILLSDENGWNYITPTTFDIDASSVSITLDASYCCLAINKFKVIQHTGKTAIVVDKLGNTIFDGTNLGAGVYHFTCDFVPYKYGELYITMSNGTVKNCPSSILPSIYSGYNEKWTVTKQELIEPPAST